MSETDTPKLMSGNTPRTDTEAQRLYDAKNWNTGKAFDFARQLECELAEAKELYHLEYKNAEDRIKEIIDLKKQVAEKDRQIEAIAGLLATPETNNGAIARKGR